MYKNILIATDCSEFSEGAVREGINMAKSCGSRLHAMSVVEINPEFIALAPKLLEEKEKETRKCLEGIRDRAAKENVECDFVIREGDLPHKLILEEAEKKRSELVVMGRRGRTGLSKILMGSVTARVVGYTTRRVLVVPRAASITWGNIVIATDGSKYSEAAAKEAISLAKHCGEKGTLHALAVVRKSATEERIKISENALEEINAGAQKENVKVDTLLVKDKSHESIYATILEYAKEKSADIVVMGSRGRSGIQKLLMGSVTERVIGHAECAVLVVKTG